MAEGSSIAYVDGPLEESTSSMGEKEWYVCAAVYIKKTKFSVSTAGSYPVSRSLIIDETTPRHISNLTTTTRKVHISDLTTTTTRKVQPAAAAASLRSKKPAIKHRQGSSTKEISSSSSALLKKRRVGSRAGVATTTRL
jgi:hypothetical protein